MNTLIDFIEQNLRFAAKTGEIEIFRHWSYGAAMFYQELLISQGVSYEAVDAVGDLWNTEYSERFDKLLLELKA